MDFAKQPEIEIRLSLSNLTPGEAAVIATMANRRQLKTEWSSDDKSVVITFKAVDAFDEFFKTMRQWV